LFVHERDARIEPDVTIVDLVGPVQLRPLDLLEQHRRNGRLLVHCAERESSHEIGLGRKKMNWRAHSAARRC